MEENSCRKEASSKTQRNILDYFKTHDLKYIAEDAVFKNLGTGEIYKGKEEIGGMLHFMYHVAFEAKAEKVNYVITENKAVPGGLFQRKTYR